MKAKYFFHASNLASMPAFLEVRAELGWEGYGIAIAVLEIIASSEEHGWPMQDLRAKREEYGFDRMNLLRVLKILELEKIVLARGVRIDGCLEYFLYSPMLEEQLQSRELQRMAKAMDPREKTHRPAIPKEVRAQVLGIGRCTYCGATEDLQVDHIYPYSKGGAHSIENFQPLCKPCNYAKRDKTEEQYFALIGRTHGTPHPH